MADFNYFFIKALLDRCIALKEYRYAKYVGKGRKSGYILELPSGEKIGFGGWADHASGRPKYFFDTFRYWGFADIEELYSLPIEWRTRFFDESIALVEGLFGQDLQGLKNLLDELERASFTSTINPVKSKLQLLKAQDIEREVHAGIAQIVEKIKSKATEDAWRTEKSGLVGE